MLVLGQGARVNKKALDVLSVLFDDGAAGFKSLLLHADTGIYGSELEQGGSMFRVYGDNFAIGLEGLSKVALPEVNLSKQVVRIGGLRLGFEGILNMDFSLTEIAALNALYGILIIGLKGVLLVRASTWSHQKTENSNPDGEWAHGRPYPRLF